MTNQPLYLGRVEIVIPESTRGPFAQIQPLCRAVSDEQEPNLLVWSQIDDVRQEFPSQGYVTWFEPPRKAVKGTVWQFGIERQRSFEADKLRRDAYKTYSIPTEPWEIIDLRTIGDEEQIRQRITVEGLPLSFTPSGNVYLWIDDKTWIGPVHLINLDEANVWKLDINQPLRCHTPAPKTHIKHVQADGGRLFLSPGAKAGNYVGLADWAPISSVIKSVLKRLQKIDPEYRSALDLTDKVIERSVAKIGSSGLGGENAYLYHHRLQRARAVVSMLEQRQELIDDFLNELLVLPSIADKIKAAEEDAKRRAKVQIEEDLAAAISQAKEKQAEADSRSEEIALLEQRINELREKLTNQIATFEDSLEEALKRRIDEAISRPEQLLADVAVFRTLLKINQHTEEAVETSLAENKQHTMSPALEPSLPPSWACLNERQSESTSNSEEFYRGLETTPLAQEIGSKATGALHAAFLAGAIPILAGSGALKALEAYSSIAVGERILWLPVPASAVEPSDLLGRIDPTTRRFIPQPGGLLDLLLHARNSDQMFLVVIDGISRAPIDAYLTPLLSCYSDNWRGERRRLSLFHPSTIASNDLYASASWLEWPSNVLMAATLAEGMSMLPLPETLWDSVILFPLDQLRSIDNDLAGLNHSAQVCSTYVPGKVWQEWRRTTFETNAPIQPLEALIKDLVREGFSIRHESQAVCARYYAAHLAHTHNEKEAIEAVITFCMLPQAITSGQDKKLLRVLEQTQLMSENIEEASRLLGKLLV